MTVPGDGDAVLPEGMTGNLRGWLYPKTKGEERGTQETTRLGLGW